MGIGFRPIRGNWRTVQFTTASAATFQTFAPVEFDGHRDLIEATSAATSIVGVALSYSTASSPYVGPGAPTGGGANAVSVAVPMDQSAIAVTNVATNVARSALSFGQVFNITKSANNLRVDTTSQATALVQIVSNGLSDSTASTVEVSFVVNARAYSSVSSSVIF
jgi:hypothetical protein